MVWMTDTCFLTLRGDEPAVTNGKNPAQEPHLNLSAQAVTRGVGGMTVCYDI